MSLDLSKAAPKIALIDTVVHGEFPGENGGTNASGQYFDFRTNFRKGLLEAYIKVIAENDFPEDAFGIGEKATGYNEDEDYEFPVSDCYAFYIGEAGREDCRRFSRLLDEETKDPQYAKTQPWVVKKEYQG